MIKKLLQELNCLPRDIMRTKEEIYKQNQLDNPNLTNSTTYRSNYQIPETFTTPYRYP